MEKQEYQDMIKQLDSIKSYIERNDISPALEGYESLRKQIQDKLELIEAVEIADALIGDIGERELLTNYTRLLDAHKVARELGIKDYLDMSKFQLINKINRILIKR